MASIKAIEKHVAKLTNGRGIPSWCDGTAGLVASFLKMSREHDSPTSIEIDRKRGGFSCYARPATLRLTEDKIIIPVSPKYKPKAVWARDRLDVMLDDLVDGMENDGI